jgi:pre-mRNA-splicing factor ATP-dependent RNA helicase DHX15/PRP43
MSATLDAGKFKEYFNQAPHLHITGRTYPVEVNYLQEATSDYIFSSLSVVNGIHRIEGPGDILVFLSGEDEIERLCSLLRNEVQNLDVLPLYSRMSPQLQQRIYQKSPRRKCIVTTNVAETSLTIDGIVYVVDTGLAKQMLFNPRAEQNCLRMRLISQASARQRMGRAGRTQPGICYRLYTKKTYDHDMPRSTAPGILFERLESAVLTLKQAGYDKVTEFDFMDTPHPESLSRAVGNLNRWYDRYIPQPRPCLFAL